MSQFYLYHFSIYFQMNLYVEHFRGYIESGPIGATTPIQSREKRQEKRSVFIKNREREAALHPGTLSGSYFSKGHKSSHIKLQNPSTLFLYHLKCHKFSEKHRQLYLL